MVLLSFPIDFYEVLQFWRSFRKCTKTSAFCMFVQCPERDPFKWMGLHLNCKQWKWLQHGSAIIYFLNFFLGVKIKGIWHLLAFCQTPSKKWSTADWFSEDTAKGVQKSSFFFFSFSASCKCASTSPGFYFFTLEVNCRCWEASLLPGQHVLQIWGSGPCGKGVWY